MKKKKLIVLVGRKGSGHEQIAEKCRREHGFAYAERLAPASLIQKNICIASPGRAKLLRALGRRTFSITLVYIAASFDKREELDILKERNAVMPCEQEDFDGFRQHADYIFSCGGRKDADSICDALDILAVN